MSKTLITHLGPLKLGPLAVVGALGCSLVLNPALMLVMLDTDDFNKSWNLSSHLLLLLSLSLSPSPPKYDEVYSPRRQTTYIIGLYRTNIGLYMSKVGDGDDFTHVYCSYCILCMLSAFVANKLHRISPK